VVAAGYCTVAVQDGRAEAAGPDDRVGGLAHDADIGEGRVQLWALFDHVSREEGPGMPGT